MTDYLRMPDWWERQIYKDRRPPWFAVYQRILDEYQFAKLPTATRFLYVGLCALGSRLDNAIPGDPDWIASQVNLAPDEVTVGLEELLALGWLEPASKEQMQSDHEEMERRIAGRLRSRREKRASGD